MSIEQIIANAQAHERAMLTQSRVVLEGWGDDATETMQQRAPWQDRPDDKRPKGLPHARELLDWVPVHPAALEDGGAVALVTGAEYGIHLETANTSTYAVIMPTVATEGPDLTRRLKQEVWK